MTFVIIALCILVLAGLIGLKGLYSEFRLKRVFRDTVRDFLTVYDELDEFWETDYDETYIKEAFETERVILRFGSKFSLSFATSKELRECMIVAGEFIIEYYKILQESYAYEGNKEEFNNSMEALKRIRTICLQKGENANFVFNRKTAT